MDELAKLGGRPCLNQRDEGGCRIHPTRPAICRAYRCAWLAGAFEDADRPDRLGAVLDMMPRGDAIHLVVRQLSADACERSPRLQQIVADMRANMPVELRDIADVLDPDHAYRVLHPSGDEFEIVGDRVRRSFEGVFFEETRAPWLPRQLRRIWNRFQAWRLSRWPSHEERVKLLASKSEQERS